MANDTFFRIGVLGGGQLGRMLALAGIPFGIRFFFLDAAREIASRDVGTHFATPYSVKAIEQLANAVDVVTFEFENIPVNFLEQLNSIKKITPSLKSLEVSQDRLLEKEFLTQQEIPVVPYIPVSSFADISRALEKLGSPCILKTRRFGYDGKGQVLIPESNSLRDPRLVHCITELTSVPCILEKACNFTGEVALVGTFARSGESIFYPLTRTCHSGGILHKTITPCCPHLQSTAENYLIRLAKALGYVGTITLEFFLQDGNLIANEFAPRVHNSGHWSIEGSAVSQFENHIRAITGLPLGKPKVTCPSIMWNILSELPDIRHILSIEGASYHWYGKSPRDGRKLGHVTLVGTPEMLADMTWWNEIAMSKDPINRLPSNDLKKSEFKKMAIEIDSLNLNCSK
jgi:5-(carboxyamino)imidazole ribonucleotide synthase